MPLPLAAIPAGLGAVQSIAGVAQLIGGRQAAKNAQNPGYGLLEQNLYDAERIADQAENRARYGIAPSERAAMERQARQSAAQSLAMTRNANLSPAAQASMAGRVYAQEGNAMNQVAAQSDQLRRSNQRYADSMRAQVADDRTRLRQAQMNDYMRQLQSANQLQGAGLQNIWGGMDSAAGVFTDKMKFDQAVQAANSAQVAADAQSAQNQYQYAQDYYRMYGEYPPGFNAEKMAKAQQRIGIGVGLSPQPTDAGASGARDTQPSSRSTQPSSFNSGFDPFQLYMNVPVPGLGEM